MPGSGRHRQLQIPPLRSLAFAGDGLVDWLGGRRVSLDGDVTTFGTGYTYRFDAALGLGEVGLIYEAAGTKGVILRANGMLASPSFVPMGVDIVREIDRSFYQAEAYAFPAALFTLPDGREAIAHCPRGYDRLDVELLDGTLLTAREAEEPDFFHARLQVSGDGRWLLSNGWIWQPWSAIQVYAIERALADPSHLASAGIDVAVALGEDWTWEVEAATVVGDRLVVATNDEVAALAAVSLVELDRPAQLWRLDERPGTTLLAWDADHVVCLDGVPRIVSLETGAIVHRWSDLAGGPGLCQPSASFSWPGPPWVAVDPGRPRFAIARPKTQAGAGAWILDVVEGS